MAAAIAIPVDATAEQSAFDERLRVAESAVIVEIPQGIFARSPRARDLVVELGDSTVEATQVQRLAGREDWTVLLYIDAPLTSSDTLFRSALALARASEALTALGPVQLLVATSRVEARIAPSRVAQTVESALADVATEASRGDLGGDLVAAARSADSEPAIAALVSRQTEALITAVGDRCPSDVCLLLLVSEGFPETPAAAAGEPEVARAGSPQRRCCSDHSLELALELAASRWLVGVVAVQRPAEGRSPRERRTEDRQLDAAIPDHRKAGHAAFSLPRRAPLSPERLDLAVRLESSPLKRIVRQSAGFLTATPEELQDSLRALERRWLVWFREPPEMASEATVQLRVVDLPRDRDLRAPQWWRPRFER